MKLKITIILMLLPVIAGASGLDDKVNAFLKNKGVQASEAADNARLVRRYYLTITDRIPTEAQTQAFIANPDRERLVDSLLASDGFVRKQVLKWGDLLRIKSEFPSCMWPNAVQAFNKWLTEEFRANTPYNVFVADMLSATGSNFRVPQTNFYRAGSNRTPEKFASDVALLFYGWRQAPQEWPSFFCQVKFKSTKEWKEEILCLDIDAVPSHYTTRLGDGQVQLVPGSDFRQPFIEWLTSRNNRDLARAYVNRLWSWLMGEGLIMPVDDIQGRDAVAPEVLDCLTDRFLSSGFNVRALAKEILLSEAFCRSSLSTVSNAMETSGFSHFLVHRLTSEQICDALCDIFGVYDTYSSRAPEPFTNFPAGTHANEVCDGTITTPQLDIFGKPSRDVALESSRDNSVNAKQILYLLNATDIQDKLAKSPVLEKLSYSGNMELIAGTLYLRILSRPMTAGEYKAVLAWMGETNYNFRQTAEAIAWALINTDEFLFLN